MVTRHPPPAGTILDLGGGNGFVARRLVDEGFDVVLLEPGVTGARNARSHRQLEKVVCASVESAGFPEGAFSAIGMFDVIEHIRDDASFLERIRPLLAPSGKLYLTVPCHNWLWSQADVSAGHFRRHNSESLQSLLAPGFRIDYLSYIFAPLVAPQFLLRAVPHRLGLERKGTSVVSSESEHGTKGGVAVRLVERLLEREAAKVARGERIAFGASCLIACTRR